MFFFNSFIVNNNLLPTLAGNRARKNRCISITSVDTARNQLKSMMSGAHTRIQTHTGAHTCAVHNGVSHSEMNQIKYLLFSIQ